MAGHSLELHLFVKVSPGVGCALKSRKNSFFVYKMLLLQLCVYELYKTRSVISPDDQLHCKISGSLLCLLQVKHVQALNLESFSLVCLYQCMAQISVMGPLLRALQSLCQTHTAWK